MREIWKPIPGYLNYKVSNFGRVKSIDRIDAAGHRLKGRILKLGKGGHGYLNVVLYEDSHKQTKSVHRLIMETFVGPCPEGMEVNHIDENPENNRLDNLEYVSHTQNINHGTGIGRMAKAHSKPVRQLTLKGEFVAEHPSRAEAERETGVNNCDICSCVNGKRKTAGGYRWEEV